eukprot:Plantae.Rhodophyta-Hildenbrandia_rubra.ctg10070.p1 GENE.Plantae.Rhodophyta-Hildenbrandia_rubra.ctg10070~~Plantae.Rhodophyta-Hildenbrandia_rubra.ctg10070.p1  ORF type:complete len:919 (+),score=200.79 Plantae.Rhodophyta-Hildenbrandia_rubra.ctg10070:782-3538(+)
MRIFLANTLPRTVELIEVGQVSAANQALYDIITDNQTRRRQWSKVYEGIMMKLMELSVQLQKPAIVKESLHKYRAMCLQTNVASLEEVVRKLVKISEARTEEARESVSTEVDKIAEDLDSESMETPQTLLLEAAGAPQSKERIDRQQVVPWMRFLWEIYRVVLDIVKSHTGLEATYHEMACKAFAFCAKYSRFTEFRRLCDMLRQHLSTLIKYPRSNPNDVTISSQDTTQKHLETRFTQLSTAITLNHYQEAYRTVEDIHMIMQMSKARPRAAHMSIYYSHLTTIFFISGNYLYHAYALYKLYTLSTKQNRNLSKSDAQILASRLLLAALSIPVYDAQSAVLSDSYGAMTDMMGTAVSENAARHARMAGLLGLSAPAERNALLKELGNKRVIKSCHEELQPAFSILEESENARSFAKRISGVLSFIESQDELKEYAEPLRRVAIYRLLELCSRVYDVMRLNDLKEVASFAPWSEVEDTALISLKTRALAVRFDHRKGCIRFESALFSTEGMRSQLGKLARRMAVAAQTLGGNEGDSPETMESRRQLALKEARSRVEEEQKLVLRRKDLIERRKEEAERQAAEIQHRNKVAAAQQRIAAQEKRKVEELKRRQAAAASRESSVGPLSTVGPTLSSAMADGKREDEQQREARMMKEREAELKTARESERKISALASHLNYVERASREYLWDRLNQDHKNEAQSMLDTARRLNEREQEEAVERHAVALQDKKRITKFGSALERFMDTVVAEADAEWEKWKDEELRRRSEAERLLREEQERIDEEVRQEEERLEQERIKREKEEMEDMKLAEQHAARLEAERRKSLSQASGGKYVPPTSSVRSVSNGIGPRSASGEERREPSRGYGSFGRKDGDTTNGRFAALSGRESAERPKYEKPVAASEPPQRKRFINSKLSKGKEEGTT